MYYENDENAWSSLSTSELLAMGFLTEADFEEIHEPSSQEVEQLAA